MAQKRHQDVRVGATVTLAVDCYDETTRAAKNPASAAVLVVDRSRPTTGTADSGSTTTIVDAEHKGLTAEPDDFWIGLRLKVTHLTGTVEETSITDFVKSTGTFTFSTITEAVVAGDTYELLGYPLHPKAAGTVSTNRMSHQFSPSDITGRPVTDLAVVWYPTFAGSETIPEEWLLTVLPAYD